MSDNFSGIAWYYGDNDLITRLVAVHVICSTDSRMTCSTDMDSRKTSPLTSIHLCELDV